MYKMNCGTCWRWTAAGFSVVLVADPCDISRLGNSSDIYRPALAADDLSGECVITWFGWNSFRSALHKFLCLLEILPADNSGVCILYIVLIRLTMIVFSDEGEGVERIGFLAEGISNVFLVC